nr:hypothetical protein PECWAHUG_PECWAHUG_CDS_0008 [Microvirus sp.]
MAKRSRVSPRTDRKIFRQTATKSKTINLAANVSRGGIRL